MDRLAVSCKSKSENVVVQVKAMLTALGGEIDTRFDPAGLIVQMGLHLSDSAPPSTS